MRPIVFAFLLTGYGAFAQPHHPPTFGGAINTVPAPNRAPAIPGGRVLTPPPAPHPRHSRTAVVPYPVFYGGYYGYDAQPAPYAQPQQGYDQTYADGAQSPIVIINQNYRPDAVNPVIRDYSNTPLPEPTLRKFEDQAVVVVDAEPTIYLIAMRDHTIFPALAYWVEGDTLNYITTEGSHNRATLDLVDRDFSKQLNDERHIQFKLPRNQ